MRVDRDPIATGKKLGGGVLLATRKSFKVISLNAPHKSAGHEEYGHF